MRNKTISAPGELASWAVLPGWQASSAQTEIFSEALQSLPGFDALFDDAVAQIPEAALEHAETQRQLALAFCAQARAFLRECYEAVRDDG